MFGLDTTILSFMGLATLASGGLIYAFMFDRVSNEVRQEKRVKSVQNRLGHQSAVETLDTYSHLWPDSDEETRDAVDSVLRDLAV